MRAFLLRRILSLVPTVLGATLLVFLVLHFAPGDPVSAMLGADYSEAVAQRLRADYRLDDPILVQYVTWLGRLVQGDMGRSYAGFGGEPVSSLILRRAPTTLSLTVAALLLACVVGIPAGVLSARYQGSVLDHAARFIAIVGFSMPVFWSGILLIMLVALNFSWLPAGGSMSRYGLRALVLPAITLAIPFAGVLTRLTRGVLLDVLSEDYIRTAYSKGLAEGSVLFKHALRNTLLPIITLVGLQAGVLLGGAVITETVFDMPGLGRLLLEGISQRNYPVVQGVVLVIALAFIAINLLVDLTYGVLDPRVVYE